MKRGIRFALRGAKCTGSIAGAPLRPGRWLAWGMALLCSVVTQAQTWTSQNIGAVALAGSATTSGSAITLRGSGADIWDSADAFRFHHHSMTGDGEIFARISNRSGGAEWQKAGLMIRESLAPNARNVLFLVNGQTVRALQYRTTAGGPSAAHSTFDYSAYQHRDLRGHAATVRHHPRADRPFQPDGGGEFLQRPAIALGRQFVR